MNIFKRRFVCVCVFQCLVSGTRWLSVQQHINTLSMIEHFLLLFLWFDVCMFVSVNFFPPYSDPFHYIRCTTVHAKWQSDFLLLFCPSNEWEREKKRERKKKELMKRTKRFQLAQVCECDRAPSFQMKGMEHYVYWISIWIQVLWLSFFYIIIFNSWAHLKWTWELARVFVVWARTHSIHNTLYTHNECMRNAFCPVHFCAHAQTKRANAYS